MHAAELEHHQLSAKNNKQHKTKVTKINNGNHCYNKVHLELDREPDGEDNEVWNGDEVARPEGQGNEDGHQCGMRPCMKSCCQCSCYGRDGRVVGACNGQGGNVYRVGLANGGVHDGDEVSEVDEVREVEDEWAGRVGEWDEDSAEHVREGDVAHEDVLLEGVEDHGAWVDAKEVKAELVGSPDDARDDNLVVMERVELCGPLKGTDEGHGDPEDGVEVQHVRPMEAEIKVVLEGVDLVIWANSWIGSLTSADESVHGLVPGVDHVLFLACGTYGEVEWEHHQWDLVVAAYRLNGH